MSIVDGGGLGEAVPGGWSGEEFGEGVWVHLGQFAGIQVVAEPLLEHVR
jgi:hypothetical protein